MAPIGGNPAVLRATTGIPFRDAGWIPVSEFILSRRVYVRKKIIQTPPKIMTNRLCQGHYALSAGLQNCSYLRWSTSSLLSSTRDSPAQQSSY